MISKVDCHNDALIPNRRYGKSLRRISVLIMIVSVIHNKSNKACYISKRKAEYLLRSCLIPCKITNKKTHSYIIGKADVRRDFTVAVYRYI